MIAASFLHCELFIVPWPFLAQLDIGKEVGETLDGAKDDVYWLFRLIPREVWENPWVRIGLAIVVLVVLWRVLRRVWRFVWRTRPATVNATLSIYGESYTPREQTVPQMRREAAAAAGGGGAVAVSTGPAIKGFLITKRIETLRIAGCDGPDEALAELRLAAADRGANAVVNVQREKAPGGRHGVSGEAVVVVQEGPARGPSAGGGRSDRAADGGSGDPGGPGYGGRRGGGGPSGAGGKKAAAKADDEDDDSGVEADAGDAGDGDGGGGDGGGGDGGGE